MTRKVLSILLLITYIISQSVFALNGIDNNWAGIYAQELFEKGIMTGDDKGNANLKDNIKRSEFLALLVRALYDKDIPNGSDSFVDVKKTSWYYNIASYAKGKGIVNGDEYGKLLPENYVKREEIVLMIVRALKLTGGNASFSDLNKDYIYYNEISAAVQSKIINGYDDGTFKQKNMASRGEAAAMISRMLKIINPVEPNPTQPPSFNEPKVNLTWHQIYNKGVNVTGNHMDGLNVISPTWFRVIDNTGKTPFTYEYKLDGDNNLYFQDLGSSDYMKDSKTEGYKVWAMLKTDFSAKTTSAFLNSDSARWSAINQTKNMIQKYDLDGINLDFENMYLSDKDIYTWFVKEMSDMCKKEGVRLSVDVTKYDVNGGTWSLCYDRAALAKYADYIALMAYDENGTWSKEGGSVSSLSWVENAIKITLNEVPPEKLLLSIPFYTRLWEEKDGKVVKTTAIGMKTAQNKINEAGAEITYDEKTGQNYAQWTSGDSVFKIWIEDKISIKSRLDLIKKYNLAGVASWSKTFETSDIWGFIDENLK